MSACGLTMTKDLSYDNLNNALLLWRRSNSKQRFGQFWMNKTDFKLPEDFLPGYALWEEKDENKAYGVIFDYIFALHKESSKNVLPSSTANSSKQDF